MECKCPHIHNKEINKCSSNKNNLKEKRGSGNLSEDGMEKWLRTEGSRELLGNSVFWTPQGACTHELTVDVDACTRSDQLMFQRACVTKELLRPTLTEHWKLRASGGKSHSWGVAHSRLPMLQWITGLHSDTYNRTQWFVKTTTKPPWRWNGSHVGEVWEDSGGIHD